MDRKRAKKCEISGSKKSKKERSGKKKANFISVVVYDVVVIIQCILLLNVYIYYQYVQNSKTILCCLIKLNIKLQLFLVSTYTTEYNAYKLFD